MKKNLILILPNYVHVLHEQSALCIPACPPSLCCPSSPSSLSHRHVTFKWDRRWASPPVKCVREMTWCSSRVVSGGPVLVKSKTSPSARWPSSALLGPSCFSPVTHSAGPVSPKTHGLHVSLQGKPGEWMFCSALTQVCRCSQTGRSSLHIVANFINLVFYDSLRSKLWGTLFMFFVSISLDIKTPEKNKLLIHFCLQIFDGKQSADSLLCLSELVNRWIVILRVTESLMK